METDENVGKRVAKGYRRGTGIVFRDDNPEDSKSKNCSRAGCISRVCSSGGSCSEIPEKPKHEKASFRTISGKAIAESSSKPFLVSSTRTFFQKQQNQAHLQETTVAESSHRQKIDDINNNNEEVLVDNLYSNGVKEVTESEPKVGKSLRSSVLKGLSTDIHEPSSNCSIASSSKVHKQISRRLVSGNQEASASSFGPRTVFASRNTTQTDKSFSQCLNSGAPRCGLKSLSSTTATEVFPSNYPSSVSSSARRIDMSGKKPSEGESSAANSRIPTAETSVPSISVTRIMRDPVSRSRNRITTGDRAFSVRTRRTSQATVEESGSTCIPSESIATQVQQSRTSVSNLLPENSGTFSIDFPHGFSNLSGQPSSRSHSTQSREASHPEGGTHITRVSLGNQPGYRHFRLEGVAEILLALEQIEQERDLTYEQLLVLQSNLLLGAIRFHDRHRDMRMDIDNMSYEELLALEEKMGTISTALTEDQLSKCLKKSTYPNAYLVPGTTGHGSDSDDIKCSICQEEYIIGDEVGRLWCEHQYHVACIQQWLRQKNWCPICKSSASPSQETLVNPFAS